MACKLEIELENNKKCQLLNIDPKTTTILKLKQLVQDKEGYAPDTYSIIYGGATLKDDKFLIDYDIAGTRNLITMTAVFRRRGGAKNEKLRCPDFSHPKIKAKKGEDCLLCGEEDEETIEITICGCIYAPSSLHSWADNELKDKTEFKQFECPGCKRKNKTKILSFDLVACACGWNQQEYDYYYNLFRRKTLNHKEYKNCPWCSSVVHRPSNDSDKTNRSLCGNPKCIGRQDWCWKCLEPWKSNDYIICGNDKCNQTLTEKNTNLKDCPTKNFLWGSINCTVPIFRACINENCNTVYSHSEDCNHMTCPYCATEFCFLCLQKWPCKKKYEQHNEQDIAPRQVLKSK